nr:glycosyltransferase family 4 protein [uncultured Oscillibacter sp.]
MKILITSDWYAPAVNGVVTSVKNLRRELERRGHEVRVLTLSQSRRSWEKDDVTYLGSIAAGLVYPGARLRTALAGKWVRRLVDWGPDVVHSQCEFSTFFLARRIAEERNIPLVHTYHTVYEDYTHYFSPSVRFGRQAAAVFSRWVAARTDCMIAPTGKVRLLLQNYGVSCPVFVVPSGIDLAPFRREADPWRSAVLRASLDIPAERTILVFVGRLAEEKNIDELLCCRAALGDAAVTLLIVGDGPDRPRLTRQAAALGLTAPDVVFAGMVPPEQVADWYQLGDLFVSASTSETQGLTYIEALAAGVPALCRADPCLTGILRNGENGWQYRDEADFQSKLADFLAQPHRRERLARSARASAEEFSAQRFAERMEAVYEEQIAHRGGTEACREVPA